MKLLHIFRSEPGDLVRQFIAGMAQGGDTQKEVRLQTGRVDYDQLVKDIFASDRIVCWW